MTVAVLFDVDGTLLELDVDIDRVRRDLASMFGHRGYRETFRPVLLRIAQAARQVTGDEREVREWIARGYAAIDAAELDAAARARARPGAAAALEAIHGRGFPTGLITDNGRACLGIAFESCGLGALSQFRTVVSRDDVEHAKPDPAGVIAAAAALLPDGGTLWLVGDSPRDVAAGRKARPDLAGIEVRIAAVAGGRGDPAELEAAGADAMVASIDEIVELIG